MCDHQPVVDLPGHDGNLVFDVPLYMRGYICSDVVGCVVGVVVLKQLAVSAVPTEEVKLGTQPCWSEILCNTVVGGGNDVNRTGSQWALASDLEVARTLGKDNHSLVEGGGHDNLVESLVCNELVNGVTVNQLEHIVLPEVEEISGP